MASKIGHHKSKAHIGTTNFHNISFTSDVIDFLKYPIVFNLISDYQTWPITFMQRFPLSKSCISLYVMLFKCFRHTSPRYSR